MMTGTPPLERGNKPPATFFASPERAAPDDLLRTVTLVTNSTILNAAMEVLGGWVAVLNEHRQVLAINHSFLEKLGIDDPGRALGLRPGEALNCAHASDHPAGCGTSRFCASCGAVLAMAAAQETEEPQQRECVISVRQEGRVVDYAFEVNCCPLSVEGQSLLLLSMRDISEEKRRTALERTFLHDISNVLTALGGAAEQLACNVRTNNPMLLDLIRESSETLYREIRVQRLLCQDQPGQCRLMLETVDPTRIIERIEAVMQTHPAAAEKSLVIKRPLPTTFFETDPGLLARVLVNMAINAFEASSPGDQVRIEVKDDEGGLIFSVWSRPAMSEQIAQRVFQRYFSTKSGGGRGLGTYSMKLLGETLLKGEVGFTNSVDGVTFTIRHPLRVREDAASL